MRPRPLFPFRLRRPNHSPLSFTPAHSSSRPCFLTFPPTQLPDNTKRSFTMKMNIAYPATGLQKILEIDDEAKLQNLYERRMAQEVDGGILGEEWAGYVLRITGGNDKQGFPMKQGVLTNTRVR